MRSKRPVGSWFDQPGDVPGWLRISLTCIVPLTLLGVLVGAWWVSRALDRLVGVRQLFAETVCWAIATPLLIIGLALMIWSISRFVAVRGTPVPFNPPRTLVTTGPYRYTRHPMATGFVVAILGLGVGSQSIAIILIMVPLAVVLLTWEIRSFEEPQLHRRFGDAYLEYKKHVPMLCPRFKHIKSNRMLL